MSETKVVLRNVGPQRIAIVGAGFSGLTLAYYLKKDGHQVTIFEKEQAGGIIQTHQFPEMQVETAANAFLWSPELQFMCDDIKCNLEKTLKLAKSRFIWRETLRKWPIGFSSTMLLIFNFLPRMIFQKRALESRPEESIRAWCLRVLNDEILQWLVAPALQGIYAGDPNVMSASLILKPLFAKRKKNKPKHKSSKMKGSVAPLKGMSEFFSKLSVYLVTNNVKLVKKDINKDNLHELLQQFDEVILATSPWVASEILNEIEPEISKKLNTLDYLPVVRATIAFAKVDHQIKGFGVLIPRGQDIRSLGVLANSCIFPNRGTEYNESWILGGALDRQVVSLSNEQILQRILTDRSMVLNDKVSTPQVAKFHITKWPRGFTHYNLTLEKVLPLRPVNPKLHLTGNYLGALGLTKILNFNIELANQLIRKDEVRGSDVKEES